ncbi:MAG: tetratricopeptide repeat protein [Phaeodactylibacter sp.]|nr:tetratricopeptide repeat protein [Phaeodactylibacter sp.]
MRAEDQLLIDRFMEGTLDVEEQTAFQQRLQNEPDLAEALRLRRHMEGYLDQKAAVPEFLQLLEQQSKNYFNADQVKKKGRNIWWIALIIGALLIIGLLYLLNFLSGEVDTQKLYQQVAQHTPLEIVEKSADNAGQVLEMEAAFNEGHYGEALPLLDAYLEVNPTDNAVVLAKGIALLEENRLEEARAVFNDLRSGQSLYREDGTWYYALTFLKAGDYQQAVTVLETLPETSPYYKKAKRIISR